MLAESGVFWLLRFGSGRSQWVGGLPWLVPALRRPLVVVCATVWLPPLWLSRRYAAVRADFALALSFFVFTHFGRVHSWHTRKCAILQGIIPPLGVSVALS